MSGNDSQQAAGGGGMLVDDGRNALALLLIGVPPHEAWRALVSWQAASGFAPPIDLIETDQQVLSRWRDGLDDRSVLHGPRIAVHDGPRALARFAASLREDTARMLPTQIAVIARDGATLPTSEDARRVIREVAETRMRERRKHVAMQQARFETLTRQSWAERFQKAGVIEPALRVVGFTTRHSTVMQHAMRDLGGAFRRQGCEFELIMEPHPFTSTIEVARLLAERECDLVVVINHLRRELDGDVHPQLPYVCWIQDHMPALWQPQAGRSVGELDLVLGQSRSLMTGQYDYPPDRFLETSNLTDPATYSDEPLDEAELDSHRCDLSYVSHGSATPEDLLGEIVRDERADVVRCLTLLLERMRVALDQRPFVRSLDLATMLLESEEDAGVTGLSPEVRLGVLFQKALALYDRLLRHQTLQWAAEWARSHGRTLRIHGRGWERHPTLGPFAAGEIENGRPLRALYQASRINLQVNGYGSMHQRLLDGLASGGFILVRFHPADVLRLHYEALRDRIFRDRLDVVAIDRRRAIDDALDGILVNIESLEGLYIAPASNPLRRRQRTLQARVFNLREHDNDDEGLLRRLCALRHFPRRIAGDLPGYEDVAFRTRDEFHALLDRFIGDEGARVRSASSMRRAVLENDTHDVLVRRILNHFRNDDKPDSKPGASRLLELRVHDAGTPAQVNRLSQYIRES